MDEERLARRLSRELAALEAPVPPSAPQALARLLAELERWNRRINLTAVREPEAMIAAHIMDSLSVRALLEGRRVLDVGTGAGFPGLPLAITEPGRHFTLIDRRDRKLQFVAHAVALLDLVNVTVQAVRAEDYAPGQCFDTVIARAVASLPRLVEMAGHLVGESGVFIALKGQNPADEAANLPEDWAYSIAPLSVPGLAGASRHAVLLRRKRSG